MNQQSFLDFCLMKFGQGNHMTMLMLSLSKSSDFKVFSARTRAQSRRFQISPGEQGWRSGEIARLPPMCPGFDSRTRRHMWVQFVVGSLPCSERFFSGFSDFLLSSKPTFPYSNSIWITVKPFYHEPLARVIAQALPVFDIKFTFYKERFRKASFSWRISVDGSRRNRRGKVAFSISLVQCERDLSVDYRQRMVSWTKHHTIYFASWFFANVIADDWIVERSQSLVIQLTQKRHTVV